MLLGVGPDGPVQGRRVAVTGMGVVVVLRHRPRRLLGRPAATRRPTASAGCADFDPTAWFGPKEVRRVDRFAQFSVAAADMALADAGEIGADPDRSGVVFATGVGRPRDARRSRSACSTRRAPRRVSPFLVPMMMANAGAAHVSMRAGWHGPCETIATACAAGTHAIAAAGPAGGHRPLRRGHRRRGRGRHGRDRHGRLRQHDGAVERGDVPALRRPARRLRRAPRAAAALVLEDLDHARRRGARIYAEVLGAGSTADAHHITAPAPGGNGAAACMELALADAGVSPGDIGHINAHGTSTPLNDLAEAQAIEKVFGSPAPPVTSIKGVTGHALGGAGAIEAVATALTIDRRLIPPTAGYEQPDPEIHLDVVHGQARPWEPAPALSNSFGFGGHNGCLVIGPPPA